MTHFVQLIQTDTLAACGGKQANRNGDQAERQIAFTNGGGHSQLPSSRIASPECSENCKVSWLREGMQGEYWAKSPDSQGCAGIKKREKAFGRNASKATRKSLTEAALACTVV